MCANELCNIPLETIVQDNQVRFKITRLDSFGDEFITEKIACSKKCKKVAKFGFILKLGTENESLKAFESMLKKKMNKRK
jgi:hypothetical protein